MIGIYLLFSIITQFSPQNIWALADSGPAEVSVEFERLNGIKVGAPVLAEGQLIGTVSRISNLDPAAATTGIQTVASKSSAFEVSVKISPRHRGLLRQGTIALIKSPLSASRVHPETVVELLLPTNSNRPVLQPGAHIAGYSSFEEFWSADLTMRGGDDHAFEIS